MDQVTGVVSGADIVILPGAGKEEHHPTKGLVLMLPCVSKGGSGPFAAFGAFQEGSQTWPPPRQHSRLVPNDLNVRKEDRGTGVKCSGGPKRHGGVWEKRQGDSSYLASMKNSQSRMEGPTKPSSKRFKC